MSSASVYKWRAKYGGMDASLMKRMRELEDENRRLKKMYAEERLKAEIAKDIIAKSGEASSCRELACKVSWNITSAFALFVMCYRLVLPVIFTSQHC